MKRKVRVTPPASNPFESNPMSMWMAQMGGAQAQPTEEEHIYSIAAEMLSQGFSDNEVKQMLINKGFTGAKVNELVDSLYAYIDQERELSEAKYLEDELTEEQILAEREAAERVAQEEAALQNEMYYAEDSDPGYTEEDAIMQEVLMANGGTVPSKKQFVKKALDLKKKQMGGPEASQKADDTFSEARPLQKFVSAISNEAEQKALEELYDSYFTQAPESFQDGMPTAQWGGMRGQRRAMRRMNRMMPKLPMGMPYGLPGVSFGMPSLPMGYPGPMPGGVRMANIDVRRTGLFGKPKEYTINFATTTPNQINPKEVIEQETRNIGETVEEVKDAEKEKETTTASTENAAVQEELVTADQVQVVGSGAKGSPGVKDKVTTSQTPQAKPTVKRDAWGRPEGDKWYGFDPDKKTWTNNENDGWATPGTDLSGVDYGGDPMYDPDRFSVERSRQNAQELWDEDKFTQNPSQKPVKKDKWGRPEGSKWYGYDPHPKGFLPEQRYSKESLGYDMTPRGFTEKDKWGRSPGDYWYGYDPKTGKWTRGNEKGVTDYVSHMLDEMYVTPEEFVASKDKGKKVSSTKPFDQSKYDQMVEQLSSQIPKQSGGEQDSWGRPIDSAWYGFNPETNQFTTKDQWGRPAGSEWYGYDPYGEHWTKGSKASTPTNWAPGSTMTEAEARRYAESVGEKEEGGQTGMGLYHFIYGGNEPFTFADDVPMKDTTDPYFREGGLTKYQTKGETRGDWERSQGIKSEPTPQNGSTKYYYDATWDGEKWVEPAYKNNTTNTFGTDEMPAWFKEWAAQNTQPQIGMTPDEWRLSQGQSMGINPHANNVVWDGTQWIPSSRDNQQLPYNNPYIGNYNMYNPYGMIPGFNQTAPLYPPLFGGRNRFNPGRVFTHAGNWAQQQGLPYDPKTGKPVAGITNPQIKSIDVKKTRWLTGAPKKYTITYTGQAPEGTGFGTFNTGFQPRKDWNTPYTPQGQTQQSGERLPGAFGPRSDEAFQRRNQRRAERKGYNIDWSTDGFVSPKDLQTVGKLPTKPAESIFTSADELRARQEAKLDGSPATLAARKPNLLPTVANEQRDIINRTFSGPQVPMPELTDEQADQLNPGIIDVQPEDLSQEYTALPSELAVNRNPSVVSPIVNTAGPMADMNYSFDMPGEGENYADEYEEPYSPERNYMFESLNRGSSNMPFYPIGANAPLVGPEAAADYLNESLNYNMDLPYQSPLTQPWMTQDMVDASQRRAQERQEAIRREIARRQQQVKNETRKEINSENTPASNTKLDGEKILNRVSQIHNILSEWQPDWLKESLQEELNSLRKGDWSKTPISFRQSGGINMSYPMIPKAQTMGQFNMSTPLARKNFAVMPSAEKLMEEQTPMGQFANYQNPLTGASPAIRMGEDGSYVNEGVLTDEDLEKLNQREMSVDYRDRKMTNVDFLQALNKFNTGMNFGVHALNAWNSRGILDRANQNLTGDNIFAINSGASKGTYDPLSGLFRPDEMGFKGVVQKGGSIYKEGGTTYMSAKQIADFIANGGQIEFI